jgi:hypothetical protein
MKYVMVLLAILALAVCANAVVVTCVNEGSNVVRVDYNSADETVLPRAFAMDITVDGGAVISKIYDFKVGDSNAASPGYGIFPSSISFYDTGLVKDWGTPDVNSTILSTALGGIGTSGVTIAMASRYGAATDAPHITGTLFRILVDTKGAPTVNVQTAANVTGGGVVLENATIAKFSSIGCTLGSTTPPPPSAPPAPASITYPATSSTGQYTVSWASSTGATSYQLERSANNGSSWTGVYSGSAVSYSETITNGSYLYHVRATNTVGSSGWTTGSANCVVSIPTPPPPVTVPAAPASITYPATSNTGKYTVSWSSSNGATSYQLARSADNGSSWTQIYSGSAVSYSETVVNGSYRYRVIATNTAGSSGWRTGTGNCVVSIPTPPPPVTVPAAPASISYPEHSNTGQYTITWPSSKTATSYQLERSANEGKTWIRIYSGTVLSWSEKITNGKYRYRVRAVNGAGAGSWRTGNNYCEVHIENRHENGHEND